MSSLNTVNTTNTKTTNTANNTEELYKYKAKKYHYKIQHKLKEMQSAGKTIPEGYEQYLLPFTLEN